MSDLIKQYVRGILGALWLQRKYDSKLVARQTNHDVYLTHVCICTHATHGCVYISHSLIGWAKVGVVSPY